MLNILCDDLPTYVVVDNEKYPIYTDFRDWIELQEMVSNHVADVLLMQYILTLFMDTVPENLEEAIQSIALFLAGNVDIRATSKPSKKKGKNVFSFTYDAPFIIGAFLESYGIDLLSIEYMHWWKFKALLEGLNSKCELNQRIAIRATKVSTIKDKEERNRIRKMQRLIALPATALEDEEVALAFL